MGQERHPLFKILEGRAEATWVALPWFRVYRFFNSNIIDHGLKLQICEIAKLGPRFQSRFGSVSLFGFYLVCGIAILGPRFHSWFRSVSLFGSYQFCGIAILGPRFHSLAFTWFVELLY